MANIKYQQVVSNIAQIANKESYDFDFIYEFLAAYGLPKSTITRLRSGDTNRVKDIPNAVLQKDVVYFRVFPVGTVLEDKVHEMDDETICGKYRPRYIIASDLKRLVAIDNKKKVLPLTIDLKNIDSTQSIDFFYGWTGDEIDTSGHSESEMDRKAAENINKIYAEIEKTNIEEFTAHPQEFRHSLNVFFTRLLFCLFAEDTGLFRKGQFTEAIKKYTTPDGSDLDEFLEHLFAALDTEDKTPFPDPYDEFPYVDGTIFDTSKHDIIVPRFNGEARRLILECANSDWGSINPDIFGTIFQGVVDPTHRDESGMDYTSVSNILNVINPLFLNELHEEFDKAYDDKKKLWKLLNRLGDIKIFDPACGSGNFLVIAYKELRDLENDVWARLLELGAFMQNMKFKSAIRLDHFYGIEIDDFAHELAVLSMTIAQRQCDMIFEKRFGKEIEMLPLIDVPTIKCENAARIDWQEVCPNKPHSKRKPNTSRSGFGAAIRNALSMFDDHEKDDVAEEMVYDEIYIIGNPPYKGATKQTPMQKDDFKHYFGYEKYSGNLNYVAIWFIKGARYISNSSARLAFVAADSICQGEHTSIMFPKIYEVDVDISFAYTSFKWRNSAMDNAQVTVIILGLYNANEKLDKHLLYTENKIMTVDHINPYLIPSFSGVVEPRRDVLSRDLPKMCFGSMPNDGGNLILEEEEYATIEDIQQSGKFIRGFSGGDEFVNGKKRYCLWIDEADLNEALNIDWIADRIKNVQLYREKSKRANTRALAKKSYAFGENRYKETDSIIVPYTSSCDRYYVPIGFLTKDIVISNNANAIYNANLWTFAILESKMHMVWLDRVSGHFGNGYRYTPSIAYNTFPLPSLLAADKETLNKSAMNILSIRERHSEKTLGDLYKIGQMPPDLKQAHEENDILVDQLYRKKGFVDDEERLAVLFDLYEKMIEEEKINEKAKK